MSLNIRNYGQRRRGCAMEKCNVCFGSKADIREPGLKDAERPPFAAGDFRSQAFGIECARFVRRDGPPYA